MTTFEAGDLVDVPFPFIDARTTKQRPALALSSAEFQQQTGACLLVMLTSAERSRWPNDVVLEDWASAGLKKPTILRWKVFTLEESLIVGKRGRCTDRDLSSIRKAMLEVFSGWSL
jgi:mRNA interferase MazF